MIIIVLLFIVEKEEEGRKEETHTHRDASSSSSSSPLTRAQKTRIHTHTRGDEAEHRGRWATIAEYRRHAAADREASRPGGGVIFIVCWISRPVVGR